MKSSKIYVITEVFSGKIVKAYLNKSNAEKALLRLKNKNITVSNAFKTYFPKTYSKYYAWSDVIFCKLFPEWLTFGVHMYNIIEVDLKDNFNVKI